MNAPYPNATIYPYTPMSPEQFDKLRAETGLECRMDSNGVLTLELPREWHDDKPDERTDRFVTSQPGDLTTFGSPLRQGR